MVPSQEDRLDSLFRSANCSPFIISTNRVAEVRPTWLLYRTSVLPTLPRLVDTKITPLAPLEPYTAVAAASFSISIEAISCGLISDMVSEPSIKGMPSTTYSGSLDAVIERLPLIRTVDVCPSLPPLDCTSTPEICPLTASILFEVWTIPSCSASTEAMDAVTSPLSLIHISEPT